MDTSDVAAEAELLEVEPERLTPSVSITEGHIPAAVWGLAWPTLVANVLMTLTGLINAAFVGQLGSGDAIAAVGWAEQVLMVVFAVIMSVATGTTVLVARFTGAREPEEAEEAARQSLLMALAAAAIATTLVVTLSHPLLKAMGARGEVLSLSARYLSISVLTMAPFFLIVVIGAIFRGLGDTRTPMLIMAGVNVVAVVMDYLLILGAGPFPRLGVIGAAISGNIARTAGCVASLVFMARSPLKGAMKGKPAPSWHWFRRILGIGTPTAIQTLLRTGGSLTFVGVLGRLPDASSAVAALTIGVRTEAISFMPGLAFGAAATSMVGQNLGARQPDRAEASAWSCVWQAAAIMTTVAACFLLFAEPIARVFTPNAAVVHYTAAYLRANGVAQPLLAFGMVLSGALQGAGETKAPAWVTFTTMWGVRLPATYVVALLLGLGASGAWWTMTASSCLYGVIITLIFRRGRWRTKEV